MNDGVAYCINVLERRRGRIAKALAVLKTVEPAEEPVEPEKQYPYPHIVVRKRRQFSAAARRRMSIAQKKRWSHAA